MADNIAASIPTGEFDTDDLFFRPLPGEPLRVGALGALFGLALPLLVALTDQFFSKPVFCGHIGGSTEWCHAAPTVGYWLLTALFTIGTTSLLAHWRVFRPLPISLATAIALWDLQKYLYGLSAHSLFEYTVYSTLAFAAAYLLFYWIMRLRHFAASIILSLALIGLLRWLLMH